MPTIVTKPDGTKVRRYTFNELKENVRKSGGTITERTKSGKILKRDTYRRGKKVSSYKPPKKQTRFLTISGKVYNENEVTEDLAKKYKQEQVKKIEKQYNKALGIKPSRSRFVTIKGKVKNYNKLTTDEKIDFYSKNFPEQIFQVGSKKFQDKSRAERYAKTLQKKEQEKQKLIDQKINLIKRNLKLDKFIDTGSGVPLR